MLYNCVFCDVGHSPHSHLNMPIPAVVAGVGALASLVAQRQANKANIENQNQLWQKQKQYQNELNANGALIRKQSLMRAGMNPNSDFGGEPHLQAPSPSMATVQAPNIDTSSMAQLLQQQPLVDANVRNVNADTVVKEKTALNVQADTLLKGAQKWSIDQLTPAQKSQLETNVQKMTEEIENVKVDRELMSSTIQKVMAETQGMQLQNILTERSTPLILEQYGAQIALLNSKKQLTDAETLCAYKSLDVMAQQIRTLSSQENLNNAQSQFVAQQTVSLMLSNDFNKFRNAFKEDFVFNELKMSRKQVEAVEKGIEQATTNIEYAPLNAVSGALGSIGVAFGGIATGANQLKQFNAPPNGYTGGSWFSNFSK